MGNEFVAVKLQRKENDDGGLLSTTTLPPPIWIGNYHMPCAFREPAVMTLHCDLVAQRIQYLASKGENDSKDSFVLAGDFNIMPDSAQYHFLTTGKIRKEENGAMSPVPLD